MSITFATASGQLTVEKSDDLLWMNLPSRKPAKTAVPDALTDALRHSYDCIRDIALEKMLTPSDS